ncbi:hypothetical protein LUZ60_006425 [Juncus effusus]|nr:hypothetical protein LUZ60_006425 [Juncus effusus]
MAGRLTLIKSVLAATPVYYMSCFKLPAWLITKIEQIQRKFLWMGDKEYSGGHCLVSWERICTPKENGGWGVKNIKEMNNTLLLKWLCKLKYNKEGIWKKMIEGKYGKWIDFENWRNNQTDSFFWKDMSEVASMFRASTNWSLGNGESINFWMDKWLHE